MSGDVTAVFPGSFDPMTMGHWNICLRAAAIFDTVTILIIRNSSKKFLFSPEEREELIGQGLKREGITNIKIDSSSGLTAEYCRERDIRILIRGLRNFTDLDYEKPIAVINRRLNPNLETVFLGSAPEYQFVSSTIIKEMGRYGRPELEELVPIEFVKPMLERLGGT